MLRLDLVTVGDSFTWALDGVAEITTVPLGHALGVQITTDPPVTTWYSRRTPREARPELYPFEASYLDPQRSYHFAFRITEVPCSPSEHESPS